jgi:hypothetical protein
MLILVTVGRPSLSHHPVTLSLYSSVPARVPVLSSLSSLTCSAPTLVQRHCSRRACPCPCPFSIPIFLAPSYLVLVLVLYPSCPVLSSFPLLFLFLSLSVSFFLTRHALSCRLSFPYMCVSFPISVTVLVVYLSCPVLSSLPSPYICVSLHISVIVFGPKPSSYPVVFALSLKLCFSISVIVFCLSPSRSVLSSLPGFFIFVHFYIFYSFTKVNYSRLYF